MNARRATIVAALAAVLGLLPASAAHATVRANVASPDDGAVLEGPVEVHTSYELFDECPSWAEIRAVDAEGDPVDGLDPVRLSARNGCDFDGTRRWEGTFDPAGFACNGEHGLQARARGMGGRWGAIRAVVVQQPPSAPSGVTVTTRVGQATVTWSASPQPDIVGYAVERRAGGGDWVVVAEPGAGTTTVTDRTAPTGPVEDRVVAFRGDGLEEDRPAAACADTGRDLDATSSVAAATVPEPRPTASPTPGGGETDGTTPPTRDPTDGGTGGGTGGRGDRGDRDAGTGGGQDADEEQDGTDPSPSPSAQRAAPPQPVETTSRQDAEVPDVATEDATETPTERFYGDDHEFSDELDYGDLGTVQAGETGQRTVSVRVPGALQGLLGERLALQRVMAPVAGGMILLSCGLHLRRWTRQGLDR